MRTVLKTNGAGTVNQSCIKTATVQWIEPSWSEAWCSGKSTISELRYHNIFIMITMWANYYYYSTIAIEWLLWICRNALYKLSVHNQLRFIYVYHYKKERVIMTNFGHPSCTQYCCEPLTQSKKWKNVPAHKLNHLSVERSLVARD